MSRPPHEPTDTSRKMVESMAGYGIREDEISIVVDGGIDPKTLRKHYRSELDTGHIKANSMVAGALFKQATASDNPSISAMIFWLKTRAGWKETAVFEHQHTDNPTVIPVPQTFEEVLQYVDATARPADDGDSNGKLR